MSAELMEIMRQYTALVRERIEHLGPEALKAYRKAKIFGNLPFPVHTLVERWSRGEVTLVVRDYGSITLRVRGLPGGGAYSLKDLSTQEWFDHAFTCRQRLSACKRAMKANEEITQLMKIPGVRAHWAGVLKGKQR